MCEHIRGRIVNVSVRRIANATMAILASYCDPNNQSAVLNLAPDGIGGAWFVDATRHGENVGALVHVSQSGVTKHYYLANDASPADVFASGAGLWFSYTSGGPSPITYAGVGRLLQNGHLVLSIVQTNHPGDVIAGGPVAVDELGNVWMAEEGDGTLTRIKNDGPPSPTSVEAVAIVPRRGGGVWFLDNDRNIGFVSEDVHVWRIAYPNPPAEAGSGVAYADAIAPDTSGGVWVNRWDREEVDLVSEAATWRTFVIDSRPGAPPLGPIAEDGRGGLWFVAPESSRRLVHLDHEGLTQTYDLPVELTGIRALSRGTNGDVWISGGDYAAKRWRCRLQIARLGPS
jgi:hypothetical protein